MAVGRPLCPFAPEKKWPRFTAPSLGALHVHRNFFSHRRRTMSGPQSFSGEQPIPPGQAPAAYPTYPPVNSPPSTAPPEPYGQPYASPDSPTVQLSPDPTAAGTADYAPAATPPTVAGQPARKHSRTGAAWVALIVAAIVFVFLLVFVVQNPGQVQVRYFGFEGTLSLGVALLFAAVAGALTAGLLGTVRILQLRSRARRAAAGK
jgi:uncharacterized integral membrane protein